MEFETITKVEGHVLILISFGLLGIRFFFHDYDSHIKTYHFSHIFILMIFTIFALELLIVMIGFFLYHGIIDFPILSETQMKYYVYYPRFIFYISLCYFVYWILKLFQKRNSHSLKETSLRKLIKHPEFEIEYLNMFIYLHNELIWIGEHEQNAEHFEVNIDQFKITNHPL